MNTLIIF